MSWLYLILFVGALTTAYYAGRRRSSPRRTAPAPPMRDDAPESMGFHAVDAKLEIEYLDAKGEVSRRKIRVRSFSDVRELGLLKAYCYMRSANRTFRIDRIRSCFNFDTGEVIEDVRAYLRAECGLDDDFVISIDYGSGEDLSDEDASGVDDVVIATDPVDATAERLLAERPALVRVLLFVAIEDGVVSDSKAAARLVSSSAGRASMAA